MSDLRHPLYVDPAGVLARLRERRAEIDREIEAIEAWMVRRDAAVRAHVEQASRYALAVALGREVPSDG